MVAVNRKQEERPVGRGCVRKEREGRQGWTAEKRKKGGGGIFEQSENQKGLKDGAEGES